ncbi:hypothetical protein [Acaryochloris sp. IP29b_bin.137]|uniref:hypothetical protein n=1 Tax=Acaryochloris sp. IP29b_bin.137 TaxID=2969217 RepID=UPI002614AA29|nr:hypothetical protein [Acaryochloris sp. IP29b_bin.137]
MMSVRKIYEQFRSLIVLLGLVELAWLSYWLLNFGENTAGYLVIVVMWILGMLGWMVLAISLGKRGIYLRYTRWFSNLIGLGLMLTFTVILFGALDVGREGLLAAASQVPVHQLVLFHILRLLAIGTILKYLQGQLPFHFLLLGSVPDFLFAVSAVAVSLQVSPGQSFLIIWHLVGLTLFFGPGLSMFFSVPSPLRLYRSKPDTSLVFQFPMLLAHSFALVQLLT